MKKEILRNITVLYVEDEDDVREFTSKTIDKIVNKVIVASNGKEGLDKFKENQDINLILTDINMPKMGGLEMCSEIRKMNQDIPIVVTTAHSDTDFLKKAIEIKVNAYALKPIDLYDLVESMIKAMEPIFLRKKLETINRNYENNLEDIINKTKLILDNEDNIVFLSNFEKIISVNKKFLDYFDVSSLEEFNEKNKSIVDTFKLEYGFFSKDSILNDSNTNLKSNKNWILKIKSLNEIDRVVKIKNKDNTYRIFTVYIDNYENSKEKFVVSLTDITEIKEKSNLLEYQATHDSLTGLFNRKKFKEIFQKELKRERRYKNSLSMIIFDINDFETLNENHGSFFGDEILKVLSNIVLFTVREQDTVVRWKDAQILVLLPQTDKKGAFQVAEKISYEIKKFTNPSIPKQISVAFGISEFQDEDDEVNLIKKAVENLELTRKQ